MNIEKITDKKEIIALVTSEDLLITDVQSALDLIMTVKYETGAERIIVSKDAVTGDFFILSSGLAGEILQKFMNYHVKFAIYGDFSGYTSKPLKDFIYEANHGKDIFFLDTAENAIEKLCTV